MDAAEVYELWREEGGRRRRRRKGYVMIGTKTKKERKTGEKTSGFFFAWGIKPHGGKERKNFK